ncbi:MAG: hypothetical protein H3C62_04865 [Gemmatimonadaceae bacterium]|nr:hypothetical protein [Gemmatimonadaceae bacterium]
MEQAERAFHARVEAAFARFVEPSWQAAHAECGPIVAVDADGGVDDVEERVWRIIVASCPEVLG